MPNPNNDFYTAVANAERIKKRTSDELIGIARALAADGAITDKELKFLADWLDKNSKIINDPLVDTLLERVIKLNASEEPAAQKSAEALALLRGFSGETKTGSYTAPSNLPYTTSPAPIKFSEETFTFTGVMAYGPRKECERLVLERGGKVAKDVNRKVDFLVVGSVGNDQWKHASYGRKIIKAARLNSKGGEISIITEDYFIKETQK